MGTILSYLEVMYNVKVNVVSDYLRLLKKTEYRPIDTFLAVSAVMAPILRKNMVEKLLILTKV